MTSLPVPYIEKTKTEELIENQLIKEDFRPYLGASILGKPCLREIVYSFRWIKDKLVEPRMKRLFNRGHWEEIVTAFDLINIGCTIEGLNIDDSIKNKFKTCFNIELPLDQKQYSCKFAFGFGSGSCDGIISNLPDAKKTKHLLENKTKNAKQFEKLKLKGVRKAEFTHFVQIQLYMKLFKLKRCLYVCTLKDTDERYYERIKFDKKIATQYEERAKNIIQSFYIIPSKINTNKTIFPCPWCYYNDICWNNVKPAVNCRTCKHIGLRGNEEKNEGYFVCELTNNELKYKKQLKGCKKYKLDDNLSR